MECIISNQSIVTLAKEQASCDLGGEAVVLNFKDGTYYGLDSVGTSVWKFIQEAKTISEGNEYILSNYEVEPKQCENDLLQLFNELEEHKLIYIKHEAVT